MSTFACRARRLAQVGRQGDLDVAQDEVVPDLRPSAARDDRLGRLLEWSL
jgi:hypothetical protein